HTIKSISNQTLSHAPNTTSVDFNPNSDSTFQRNLTFNFPASISSLDLIRGLSRRSSCSLATSHLDGSRMSRTVLQLHLGPWLESLALPGSSVTESSLLALLPHLTALRRLDLSGLDMSGVFLSREEHRQQVQVALAGLKKLDLSDLRYLSDLTFNRLTGCTPRLRRIEQTSTVRWLDLSRTSFTPESLCSVAQVEGLSLEELRLRGCKELTDYSVEVFCKHQPGLQILDLSVCTELTSRAVQAVALGLKGLRLLSLSRDWRVTDKGLADLMVLPELRTLDLSECLHVSGAEIVKGLSAPEPRARLETLSLKSCTYIRDLAVFSLAQLLGSSLRELDLTFYIYLTDLSVAWWRPPRRVSLEYKGPSFTRTFGNMSFFRPPSMPFQEKPRLVTDKALGVFREQEGASLLVLRSLQDLDLSACSKLTDSSITQHVLRYPDLQRLSLSILPEISDDSLASVAYHCRSLTSLEFSHCPRISDQGIARAAPYLARLQHLYLSYCNALTDRSLSMLVQHCKRLRTLDISMCKYISLTMVELLQSQLPFIENVHCRFVGGADLTYSDFFLSPAA
uniref:F-box and leucine rich repeat protein n=1 Tax=Oncorhynchus kisutch TaxID=8019 RepID=A0A8C7GHY2_ONCKI